MNNLIKKQTCLLLMTLICFISPTSGNSFNIIHFNDAYDVVKTPQFVKQVGKFINESTLVLFSGDIYSPSRLTNYLKGNQFDNFLQRFKISAAVLGNHELDLKYEAFKKLNDKN